MVPKGRVGQLCPKITATVEVFTDQFLPLPNIALTRMMWFRKIFRKIFRRHRQTKELPQNATSLSQNGTPQRLPYRFANCYECGAARQLSTFQHSELDGKRSKGELRYYRYRCIPPSEGSCKRNRYAPRQIGSRRSMSSTISHQSSNVSASDAKLRELGI